MRFHPLVSIPSQYKRAEGIMQSFSKCAGRNLRNINRRRLFTTTTEAADKEDVQIPAPTWSIKSLRLHDHATFQISDDELQRLAKRCLIRVDVNSVEGKKMKEDLQGIMGLVSHVTKVASGDPTPEEMYDSTGASQITPRETKVEDELDSKEINDIMESIRHKMDEVDSEFYFSSVTKPRSR